LNFEKGKKDLRVAKFLRSIIFIMIRQTS